MSTTPAAHLARLKVTYQGWQLSRTADGFAAAERGTGRTITADTVAELENQLAQFWDVLLDRSLPPSANPKIGQLGARGSSGRSVSGAGPVVLAIR